MMKKKILLVSMAVVLLFVGSSFANSGAPFQYPDQSVVYFDPDSGITLEKETLVISADDGLKKTSYHVVYRFHNPSENIVDTPIWFLTDHEENGSFGVQVDGVKVTVTDVDYDISAIANWSFRKDTPFVQPWDGELADVEWNYYSDSMDAYPIKAFDIVIEPNEAVDVVIDYTAVNGFVYKNDYFWELSTSIYYLSPAAFYDGDPIVDIYVQVPDGVLIGSNLPLDKMDDNTYELLEYSIGDDDLYLTFIKEEVFHFGTNLHSEYDLMIGIYLAIIAILGIVLRKKKWPGRGMILLFAIGVVHFISNMSYGMMFFMLLTAPVWLVLIVIAIVVWFVRRRKRTERLR
jgi:hypothetical protein